MRQLSGTHFFKSFSDGLTRAFKGSRGGAPAATRAYESAPAPSESVTPSITTPRTWLAEFPWEKVLAVNQEQCQLQNTQMTPNPKMFDQVKQLWEDKAAQNMTIVQALDFCRDCEAKAPFVFSNMSTFSQVGKTLVEDLVKRLPALEAHIVRNTAARYVSGQVTKKELTDILRFYERTWRPGLDKLSSNGVGEHPPRQSEA